MEAEKQRALEAAIAATNRAQHPDEPIPPEEPERLDTNVIHKTLELSQVDAFVQSVIETKDPKFGKHLKPLCCLKNWDMKNNFYHKCTLGVLQYSVMRAVTAVVQLVCEKFNVYGEGEFRATRGFSYCSFVNNCSQMWSLYCLVFFYNATAEELAEYRPFAKFLCVKAVVFFTFWQGICINFLQSMGYMNQYKDLQSNEQVLNHSGDIS